MSVGARFGFALLLTGSSSWGSAPASAPLRTGSVSHLSNPGSVVTIRDIIEVRDISGVSISPDGKAAVFRVDQPNVASNSIASTWYAADLLGPGATRQLADGGSLPIDMTLASAESPLWSPDSRSIYFRALKGDEVAIWRADIAGHIEQVSHDSGNVEEIRWNSTGTNLLYRVAATRSQIADAEADEGKSGVLIDGSVDPQDLLTQSRWFRGRLTTIRCDENQSHCGPLLSDTHDRWREINLLSGHVSDAPSPMTPTQQSPSASPTTAPALSSALASNSQRELFVIPVDSSASSRLQLRYKSVRGAPISTGCSYTRCGDVQPNTAQWRPAAREREILYVARSPTGASRISGWDVETDKVRHIADIPGLLGAGAGISRLYPSRCSATQTHLLCVTSDAAAPPRLESIDVQTGSRRVIHDPNAQLRRKLQGTRVQQIEWHDKWKRKATGVLVLPKGWSTGPLPLVITSYRCAGFLRGGVGGDVPELVLAGIGVAALCINSDRSLNDEAHPSGIAAGQRARLQSTLDAWEAAVDMLASRKVIDPGRVGVTGLSFGAEAARYAITFSDKFAVAAISHGGMDPMAFYFFGTRPKLAAAIGQIYALPFPAEPIQGQWLEISAALNVNRITAPVLLQTGEGEFRSKLQFVSSMLQVGKVIETHVFPHEGHQFVRPQAILTRADRNVDWLRFWLQGYEEPALRKREQYVRWWILRRK
jgi:hypothetical protein